MSSMFKMKISEKHPMTSHVLTGDFEHIFTCIYMY